MINYIFSFAYLDKKKFLQLKNSFMEDSLNQDYNLTFLTKKNFDNFFSSKFINLKNLLIGKFLLFSYKKHSKSVNSDFFIKESNLISEFLNKLDFDNKLFVIVDDNNYYFNEFLLESNKYGIKELYKMIINNKIKKKISILQIGSHLYTLMFFRINNLINKKKISNFSSYMY